MCGIAGYVGHSIRADREARVRLMTRALARRGPDAEGLYSWDHATFGHRRLSIFDLSDSGKQPMLTPDGEIGISFNGAIYNFRELRRELEGCGHRFRSQTDTEVLILGYREWGIEKLVTRCRGMFAFAIWDNQQQKAYLVRDRLGVKPLVYTMRAGALAFASTTRALRAADLTGSVDPDAIAEILEFGYVTDQRAIYTNVLKLPAGTILEWSAGQTKQWKYWALPDPAPSELTFDDAVEHTESLFLESVRMRLDADVPVGALLSGGVDSSLVCWAISKLGAKIRAFTVSTGGHESDEAPAAAATASRLGIEHTVITVSDSENPDVEQMVSAYAEPFSAASGLGMLRVSAAVKPYATVLLTGDGGDDVFLGYPQHTRLWFAERMAGFVPPAAAYAWRRLRNYVPQSGSLLRRGTHLLDYATGGLAASAVAHDGLPSYWKHSVLGPVLDGKTVSHRQLPWSLQAGRRVLRDYIHYHRSNRFVGEYMTKVDGATMHYAIEARSPFLDQELWEFAAALPVSLRLFHGQLKAILRTIARRRIGPSVSQGKKRGFTVPVQQWMTGRWRPHVDEAFHNSCLAAGGWVAQKPLLAWWNSSRNEPQAPVQLWHLFVLENWLRHEQSFNKSTPAPVAPLPLVTY